MGIFLGTFKIKSLRYWLAKWLFPYAIIYDLVFFKEPFTKHYGIDFETTKCLQNAVKCVFYIYRYTSCRFFPPQQLMKGDKINQIYIVQINEDYFSKDCQSTVKKKVNDFPVPSRDFTILLFCAKVVDFCFIGWFS